jgi:hypothetical protein
MRPRVEITDGAMLGDGTVGTPKLYPDCCQVALHGRIPEGAILVGASVDRLFSHRVFRKSGADIHGFIASP